MSLSEVLTLARAGATDAAWALLEAVDSNGNQEASALTLRGRLLKDRAASERGAARTALLREAGEAYAAAARDASATYPLINAATLSFLGGAQARAEALARETLALLDSGAHEPDTRYWLGATRAEAHLLLGNETEARAALSGAIAETPRAWEDHAATLRQFRLILAEQHRPDDWLKRFQPPPALHFAGPMGIGPDDAVLARSLEAAIETARPGTATGALAAGFDIVAAEALVRAGTELHLILPGGIAAFADASVRPYGAEWMARFDRLIGAAASVETLDEPAGLCDGAAILAEDMALGLAIREAGLRGAETLALRIAHGAPGEVPAGVRVVSVAASPAGESTLSLGAPERPLALVGCTGGRAALSGLSAAVHTSRTGDFAIFHDVTEAANAAMTLFEKDAGAVALDLGVFAPDAVDGTRVETLLAIPPRGYPVAARSAALALAAAGAPFQTAPAGAVSLAASADFFSLWRARR